MALDFQRIFKCLLTLKRRQDGDGNNQTESKNVYLYFILSPLHKVYYSMKENTIKESAVFLFAFKMILNLLNMILYMVVNMV